MVQTAAQESRSTSRPAPRPAPEAAPARPQGAPAGMPAYLRPPEGGEAANVAPREVELRGVANLDQALGEDNQRWIDAQKRQRGDVRLRFGKLAKGTATVHKSDSHYRIDHAAIPLQHALFQRIADSGVAPQLVLKTDNRGGISGFIGLGGAKYASQLALRLRKAPEIIGLAGFTLPSLTLSNHLADGQLRLGVKEAGFRLGGAFHGSFSLDVVDENVTFSASANIRVKGLEQGELRLTREPDGKISGEASVGLALPKNITGSVTVKWDGAGISGRGRVGYQGGKFSGEVTIEVLSKEAAKQREQGAKQAEKPAGTAATEKQGKRDLVVFGEGDLQFSFTDWLTGTAHVIIDAKGHLTVIGEITPQKEVELFPQKDYSKDLFKVEARASYGIPVVGNIFIFANIGMDAFAKLGPAKLYKISISGTYSTDPKKKQDFRIQGSLNISAAAGLRLRGEAGAGLEVLDHDIKAGAGINGLAGIRGYAEATPVIGYCEKQANEAEDKQGEFFIRGDLEIAAQPFLGLSGDLFVEIDAPWWSPVPDKRWTWPLGGKEWPIGGSFGINAGVDYVFGSQQWPSIEFRKVDFSADKFLTDLYKDKAASKSAKGEQPGKWKEKNAPKSEPPAKAEKKGDAQPGKPLAKGKAKPKVQPGTAKRSGKPADPNAKTADGKTVRDYQEAAKKKKTGGETKPVDKGKSVEKKASDEKLREKNKALAAAEVRRMMRGGIRRKMLQKSLKSLQKRYQLKSVTLNSGDDVVIVNSKPVMVEGKKRPLAASMKGGKLRKDPKGDIRFGTFTPAGRILPTLRGAAEKVLDKAPPFPYPDMPLQAYRPEKVTAEFSGFRSGIGDESRDSNMTGLVGNMGNLENRLTRNDASDNYQGGHLIGHQFGGPDSFDNLTPQSRGMNLSAFKKVEELVKKNLPSRVDRAGSEEISVVMVVEPVYDSEYQATLGEIARVLKERTGKQYGQLQHRRKKQIEKSGSTSRLEEKSSSAKKSYERSKSIEAGVRGSGQVDHVVQVPARISRQLKVSLEVDLAASMSDLQGYNKEALEKTSDSGIAKGASVKVDDYEIVPEDEAGAPSASKDVSEKKTRKKVKARFTVT